MPDELRPVVMNVQRVVLTRFDESPAILAQRLQARCLMLAPYEALEVVHPYGTIWADSYTKAADFHSTFSDIMRHAGVLPVAASPMPLVAPGSPEA